MVVSDSPFSMDMLQKSPVVLWYALITPSGREFASDSSWHHISELLIKHSRMIVEYNINLSDDITALSGLPANEKYIVKLSGYNMVYGYPSGFESCGSLNPMGTHVHDSRPRGDVSRPSCVQKSFLGRPCPSIWWLLDVLHYRSKFIKNYKFVEI